MSCRKYDLFARLPPANSSFCWIVGPCCVLLAVAFHRLPTHRFQELQIPRIITFKTSHTACLHCTCWRQQQKVIGAVKLADRNSSHPPHVQLGSILRMVSPQAHFSKWHNFSSVVLHPDRTIRRSPGSLHLKVVCNPCTVSYHPAPQQMIRSNFCLVFLCDGFTNCPKLSLNRQFFSFSTLQAPFRAFWRCSHDQSCGLTPFDQSVCHINSASLLITFQFCLHQTQPINISLETLHHTIVLAICSPCHNSKQ